MMNDQLEMTRDSMSATLQKNVFIVDDDESVRRAVAILLGTFGFKAQAFSCAADFFSAVSNTDHGFLIIDIHMPVVNGWEALKRLRESGSRRPVAIITANKSDGLNIKAMQAGAVGFLQKPFNVEELVGLINQEYKYNNEGTT